jgi:hypothetical protein
MRSGERWSGSWREEVGWDAERDKAGVRRYRNRPIGDHHSHDERDGRRRRRGAGHVAGANAVTRLGMPGLVRVTVMLSVTGDPGGIDRAGMHPLQRASRDPGGNQDQGQCR